MLHIRLDKRIIDFMSDQAFDIKNCVGVHCNFILCSIVDQSFDVSKGDITWGGSVSLIVGNYFHILMLEDTHTIGGGAKINANCRSLRCSRFQVGLVQLAKKTAIWRAGSFNEILCLLSFVLYSLK